LSIEVFQFPDRGTKDDLVALLIARRFVQGENPFKPGPPDTVHLFWEEERDYLSTGGIDASVVPLSEEAKAIWHTSNNWWVRTRTSLWTSTYDKQYQNDTVRAIRISFGGMFYNDHFGDNRYIQIHRVQSTPASRGLYALFSRVRQELDLLEAALPAETPTIVSTPSGDITEENDKVGILNIVRQYDPHRVMHNALVPFLVAALEHVFRDAFEILAKYEGGVEKILENRKISFADAAALGRGDITLERIASNCYSFQNLDSIQKAFKEVFGIDVWNILRRRRKVRAKLPLLSDALDNLIGTRHGVVHHFSLNRDLDRSGFLQLLHLVRAIIDVFEDEIARRFGFALGPG
jgi:hypothetical protein